MALSGVLKYDFGSYYRLQVEWTASQSQSNNTSTITAKLYLISTSGYATISVSTARAARIIIDGTTYSSAAASNKISLAGNQKKLMHTATKTVAHNSQGQKNFNLAGSIDWGININGVSGATVGTGNTAYTLNNIAGSGGGGNTGGGNTGGGNTGGGGIPAVRPPSNPIITYPTSRFTADGQAVVRWKGGVDPLGRTVTFRVAYKGGAGNPWYYTDWGSFGSGAERSRTFDTSGFTSGTKAIFAVQARNSDGHQTEFVESAEYTIAHAVAPTKPTIIGPSQSAVHLTNTSVRLLWKHNGSGKQIAYYTKHRKVGSPTWINSGWISSGSSFHDVSGTSLSAGTYEWVVATRDGSGMNSPDASPYGLFTVSAPTNAPAITSPSSDARLSDNTILVEWWTSTTQQAYQVEMRSATGALLASQDGSGTTKSAYLVHQLVQHANYKIRVRVQAGGIWSAWTEESYVAQITPPEKAVIDSIDPDEERGSLNLSYTIPYQPANILPSFNSGQWSGFAAGEQLFAWEATTYGTEIKIAVPILPTTRYWMQGEVYPTGRVQYKLYSANGTQVAAGNTTTGSGARGMYVTTPSNASYMEFSLYSTDISANYKEVYRPMLVVGDKVTWEPGTDAGFTAMTKAYIQRRAYGSSEWQTIVNDLPLTVGGYEDLSVAANRLYEYRIVIEGVNNTVSVSDIESGSVNFLHAFLHNGLDPYEFFRIALEDSREEALDIEGELMYFAGRRLPVKEYGVHETHQFEIEWVIDEAQELLDLKRMIRRRQIMLYRDSTGRRAWVTSNGVQIVDRQIYGHEISMKLNETDYDEGVELDAES